MLIYMSVAYYKKEATISPATAIISASGDETGTAAFFLSSLPVAELESWVAPLSSGRIQLSFVKPGSIVLFVLVVLT